jgi:tRNA A-37 threonylcarbamoyl transferase component Bud32
MSRIEIHPAYRALFAGLGLRSAADFLRLDGEILGGHPDRHVLRLTLRAAERDGGQAEQTVCSDESGPVATATAHSIATAQQLGVYLKKEHRVRWRNRLANWCLGYGWVSKSTREGQMLRQVEGAGIGCPRALAWGEDDGRAFLVVRAEDDGAELRGYLCDHPPERAEVARALAVQIARIHEAGFYHRDLSSKHVLMRREDDTYRFCFLDWQRARRLRRVSWRERLMDLAMLDATLAEQCAAPRERLLFWNQYLEAAVGSFSARSHRRAPNGSAATDDAAARGTPRRLLHFLCRLSARLQSKRRIRELRQAPLAPGEQNLIWLDGEDLCVTRQFLDEVGTPPSWLQASPESPPRNALEVTTIAGGGGRAWRLLRRWSHRPLGWLLGLLRRSPFPAPEFEYAAAIIRLQRYGVETPRLLALGHRGSRPWHKESFLLVEPPAETAPLLAVLDDADVRQRHRLLRQAGALWRRIHEAGYAWRGHVLTPLAVSQPAGRLALTGVEWLQRHRSTPERLATRDFLKLMDAPLPRVSATDRFRFVLGYFGVERPSAELRARLRRLVRTALRARRRRAFLERRVI